MPLGSLSTDLVRKNSMEKRANFQDTRDLVKSHLMISQVQHQNSYSKNATNAAFLLLTSLPAELPVSHVIPLQREQLLDWECCYYYIITNLFLPGDAWCFWEDSRYKISLSILRLFIYRALSNALLRFFREALVMSILQSILGLKRAKSSKK